MNETTPPPAAPPPRARLRRPRFQFVWLIPIIAAMIAGYLGYRTLIEQGPLLTLTFDTAQGLEAGQTQLKFKDVALGTVESIDLAKDNSHVIVKVRMNHVGARFLTSHARFWVERPRLNFADTSGFETLVSGAYISVDPGPPGGDYQDNFIGLEQPPGVRSDEPGSTFVLTASRIGSLQSGSPVFYRDVAVGEVLGYDLGDGLGPVKISVFIRAPFDKLVRPDSRFWNSSGIALGIQGGVLQMQLQSAQALLAGGITFNVPPAAMSEAPSPSGSSFTLYASHQEADAASYRTQIPLVAYLRADVNGLTPGAPVNMLGIQVGDVTDVSLQINPATGAAQVRVGMQVQPERVFALTRAQPGLDPEAVFQHLVDQGMRVELASASYVTGQKMIALDYVANAAPAKVTRENGALVLPVQPGGLDQVMANAADITTKLDQVPFAQIGDNLNKLLATANGTLGGKAAQESLAQLAATLKSANTTLQNLNQGFGTDSDFQRNIQQVLQETDDTMQSLKALTDYLSRNPQALLLGRKSQ
ncbi:intermembrane transport protein PqiB [Acidocella sp. KAb 2-4]|uniref:PqiB family protein n=1 Tax=Acidocella sp. KAb 2-4 TaxID=2885158 RepID=UPI001D084DE6|nr:MlaD family protein [Acidocella sp. KAb 2-4]MCB5943862.1 MlaD family protein [Acidocella sp. KAb 2-4]